jgi:hypothetical protein
MRKIIGIVLIVVALFLGYLGITDLNESSRSVELLGMEITAQDGNTKEKAFMELGLGVVALVAGIYLLGVRKK